MRLADELNKLSDELEGSQVKTNKLIDKYVYSKNNVYRKILKFVINTRIKRELKLWFKEANLLENATIVKSKGV